MQILDPEEELCWTGLGLQLLHRLKNYDGWEENVDVNIWQKELPKIIIDIEIF